MEELDGEFSTFCGTTDWLRMLSFLRRCKRLWSATTCGLNLIELCQHALGDLLMRIRDVVLLSGIGGSIVKLRGWRIA